MASWRRCDSKNKMAQEKITSGRDIKPIQELSQYYKICTLATKLHIDQRANMKSEGEQSLSSQLGEGTSLSFKIELIINNTFQHGLVDDKH